VIESETLRQSDVIVTGAARGMGASHARAFVAEGANVVIADVLELEGRRSPTSSANRRSSHARRHEERDWGGDGGRAEAASVRSPAWSTTRASCASE